MHGITFFLKEKKIKCFEKKRRKNEIDHWWNDWNLDIWNGYGIGIWLDLIDNETDGSNQMQRNLKKEKKEEWNYDNNIDEIDIDYIYNLIILRLLWVIQNYCM